MNGNHRSGISYSSLGERMEPPVITNLMTQALENPDLLSLAAGFTDNAILPQDLVREAVEHLTAGDPEYLQYGVNQGRVGLRREAVRWMEGFPREKKGTLDADSILITNGSQQCLYIAMQVLCNPGDLVLVERPTYFVFLEALKGLGIEAIGIPERDDGRIDHDGLEAVLEKIEQSGDRERLKAVYLVGYYSNPSSQCLTEEEKVKIADILDRKGLHIPVLEDAAYRDLYFDHPFPARTLFSLSAFDPFPKLFLGTFTKPLSTGMKVGFGACSDPEWLNRMLAAKGHQDFGSANLCQAIVEYVLEQDRYAPYLELQRVHYRKKARAMEAALNEAGLPGAGWNWHSAEGGLLLWLKGPPGLDTRIGSDFCNACIDQGVLYVPGDLSFTGYEPRNYVRLSYGAIRESLLPEACRRFGEVASRFSK